MGRGASEGCESPVCEYREVESVMAGDGFYSAHSRSQHVAAAVAYPYLTTAAESVPLPAGGVPMTIGDFGCAGGANAGRERLRQQSADDWNRFLTERARELVDGGELVLVAGASQPDGLSGAEALMHLIGDVLQAMVDGGIVRAGERAKMFYPTWNRTPEEWLEPFGGPFAATFEVIDQRFDAADDSVAYPQYRDGGDAAAFAQTYVGFVRAITAVPFFRWLDADRDDSARHDIVEEFYERIEVALRANPDAAAVWHTMSLRIRRRRRAA